MAIDRELLDIISGIKDTDALERLFKDLFTPAELDDLALRWNCLKICTRESLREGSRVNMASVCVNHTGIQGLKKERCGGHYPGSAR